MKRITLFTIISLSLFAIQLRAEDKVVTRILDLGRTDNRTMEHDDFLCNRIGGRPCGSHALEDAEKWAAAEFKKWGLDVIVQEVDQLPVGFTRGPWKGKLLSSDGFDLHFGTPIFTAGTKGAQRGHVLIEPRNKREFDRMKGRLKGAWVLVNGKGSGHAIDWSEKATVERKKAQAYNDSIERLNMAIRMRNRGLKEEDQEKLIPYKSHPVLFYQEMVEAGVLGFIQAADLPLTVLYDKNYKSLSMENLPTVCDIRLDSRQFSIIKRKVEEFQDIILEFEIRNHFFPGPVKINNVIGVMKGSRWSDQYVALGAHLDSYDIGTGAVDDGNGVSVVMEAARLLAAAGAKPKRTILFCLWTCEEYGVIGSNHFVESGLFNLDAGLSNYFNRDGGPTAATSITVPEAMYDDFVKVCKPIADYTPGIPFVVNKTDRPMQKPTTTAGSDHSSFRIKGLPAISFQESDPAGYNFNYMEIWHTENDIYNKTIPLYMNHSSVVSAVVAYGLSMLDHTLSREGLYR